MKKGSRLALAALVAMLCLSAPVNAAPRSFSYDGVSSAAAAPANVRTAYVQHIGETTINRLRGEATVRGTLPNVSGLANATLERTLNSRIASAYSTLLSKAGETARTIDFSYEIIADANYVSILIRCKSVSTFTRESYSCIVFSPKTEKLLTINDVLGPNGVRLANRIIASLVKAAPARFNPTIAEINNTQDFYMESNTLVLMFDQFEIAPGAEGVVCVPIALKDVISFKMDKSEYYQSAATLFDVKMIPIRTIADAFGYDILWNGHTMTAELRKNGAFISSFTIGENSYAKSRTVKRRLETAPELRNNRTHVPISFFEEVLGLLYYTDAQGNIVFTDYAN